MLSAPTLHHLWLLPRAIYEVCARLRAGRGWQRRCGRPAEGLLQAPLGAYCARSVVGVLLRSRVLLPAGCVIAVSPHSPTRAEQTVTQAGLMRAGTKAEATAPMQPYAATQAVQAAR